MKKIISVLLWVSFFHSCAEASRFNLDSSNPLALLGQMVWSLNAIPPNKQFVAVGERCSSWTSDDGIVWSYSNTRFPGCVDGSIQSVTYGNGTWVAVGAMESGAALGTEKTCGIWSSQDAETWVRSSCAPITAETTVHKLLAVSYGGSRFWASGPHNGASTNHEFFGQTSVDGVAWQYLSIEDGSSYDDTDYYDSISYNPNTSEVYFGGQHSVSSEIATVSAAALTSSYVEISMTSNLNRVLVVKSSGEILIYATLGIVKMASSLDSISNAPELNTAIEDHINIVVEGKDKLVAFGDECRIDYYSFAIGVWHPAGASAPPDMSNCSRLDWMSAAYNVTLDRFVAGARVIGTVPTAFSYSTTGLPSDWTVVEQTDIGSPGPAILGIATQ
ncbi:hypothetical protein AB3N59_11670 [Leptospira sp. WS92.C1]